MKEAYQELIKDLANIYDDESKNTFITFYRNKVQDENYLDKRVRTCAALLNRDEKENLQKTIEKINGFLENNDENTIAIFASEKHDFFRYLPLSISMNNLFIVDSSPYIRPLARILDEWESFTLVLIDSHQAKIYSVVLGEQQEKKKLSSDIINKHKKGGWSQARFQRRRKGAIHQFLKEVSENLEEYAEDRIVLAGPGTHKQHFYDLLPIRLQDRIIDIIDIDMKDEQELLEESIEIISEKEDRKSHHTVDRLKREIYKSGLAVYGLDETLRAVKIGQVDTLIIEKDYKVKGCLCEHCQILKSGPVKDCPICGGPTTEADVIEEIIEFAERTDAQIEFTDHEDIKKLGHVAGILRFKV